MKVLNAQLKMENWLRLENTRPRVKFLCKEVLIKMSILGIILAGGSWQNQVKLIKPDTKEVCNLPNIPDYFSYSSMDLVDGTPVMCGSWFGSPGKSRKK